METIKVSLIMACYGRPNTTKRTLECIKAQTFTDFELILLGDGCTDFVSLIYSQWFNDWRKDVKFNLYIENTGHHGGWGYHQWNEGIKLAKGEYIMIVANDDMIKPNHIESYYTAIKDTDYDMIYFDSILQFENEMQSIRYSDLNMNHIGHSEIIVRADKAKAMPPHEGVRGHDWYFIKAVLDSGGKVTKNYALPTYIVKNDGH